MYSGWRRIGNSSGVIWLAAIAVFVVIGCKGTSPFAAMHFISPLAAPSGGGTLPSTQDDGDELRSVCDLPLDERSLKITLFNQARQFVNYSMTFVASAGPGGFVCDEEESVYRRAGYVPLELDSSLGRPTATIGCDTLTLLSGTRLLAWKVRNVMAQNPDGNSAIVAQPPLTGGTNIPLPELIVLGDDDPIFICTGNNLCTQKGFVYTDIANNPISFANVDRTQDTVCNVNAGTAPEWRLGDLNTDAFDLQLYQYPKGATIQIFVLDRANNANPNVNQVIWQVETAAGIIHPPRP